MHVASKPQNQKTHQCSKPRQIDGSRPFNGREGVQHSPTLRRPPHDAALRDNHLERGLLEVRKVRFGGVGDDEAVVAAVVGLADGGLHADLGGDAGDDQVSHPA